MSRLRMLLYLSLLIFSVARNGASQEIPLQANENNVLPSPELPTNTDDVPSFSEVWQILGPFQIGTREASWGADPLEYRGGFRNLRYDETETFPSVLSQGGTASWFTISSTNEQSASQSSASLSVGFSDVDWALLKSFYGWAAIQFQGWARGTIHVSGSSDSESAIMLYTERILEFWIDDKHYFGGDFYGYNNVATVLHLKPGRHQIDVRLVYDVRAMGGVEDPVLDIKLTTARATEALEFVENSLVISDIIDDTLASPVASIAIRNNALSTVAITEIGAAESRFNVEPIRAMPILIAPGQTKPVAFQISSADWQAASFNLIFQYTNSQNDPPTSMPFQVPFRRRESIFESHKVTHLHSSGVVSYAMLRPPSSEADCTGGSTPDVSILVNLHGAGVEAENPALANSYDSLPDLCAWLLFPSGVTTWSDDWHIWGFHDVQAAISSIPSWIERFRWTRYGVDVDNWLVSGHSNGGQGAWYTVMHYPDHVTAAAPLSAYVSIQNYVPFNLWQPTSPVKKHLLEASLNTYSHQLLVENTKGIPIMAQHGGADDNVPAYHSRLMWKQLVQAESDATLSEIPNAGHWFDDVMTTPGLATFYSEHLQEQTRQRQPLEQFAVLSANPGDTGSKFGIRISHLSRPEIIGRIEVSRLGGEGRYTLKISNVHRFELPRFFLDGGCIRIDNEEVCDSSQGDNSGSIAIGLSENGSWQIDPQSASNIRQKNQMGGLNAILHSTGPFLIRHNGDDAGQIASQIAQNLYQYLKADSDISSASDSWESNDLDSAAESSNVITVATGTRIGDSVQEFPIQVSEGGISLTKANGRTVTIPSEDNPSAIYLRPLAGGRTELVIWGAQKDSTAMAARLVPILPGVGQPDFVVLSESCRWKGVGGVLAMGYFDYQWRISEASYIM